MDPAVTASVVGAVGSLAGNALSSGANANLNKKNREWQEKMYETQHQRNIELWNMQNAYNTPVEQVKRLREAGLNPNLMYGNGSASTGLADSVSSADVPGTPGTIPYDFSQASNGLADSIARYQTWQMNSLNMQKVQAERENIMANTMYQNAMKDKTLIGVDLDKITRDWSDKMHSIDYLSKVAGLDRTTSETWLNNARQRAVELGITQDTASFETRMDLYKAQILNNKANALNAYGNYQDAVARVASGLYGEQARNYRVQSNLGQQQYDFLAPYYQNHINPNSGPVSQIIQSLFGWEIDSKEKWNEIKNGIKDFKFSTGKVGERAKFNMINNFGVPGMLGYMYWNSLPISALFK